ncbi:MAG: 30S ribosomal protein S6 [Candidatus Omnitrophica bacterium]|nr:30S ribosomal protein S6 [Candidatus Omnitrophota bacterium]
MRDYELIAFVNETPSAALPGKASVDLIASMVKQQGGEPVKVDSLGKKFLGFSVGNQKEGMFIVSHCRLEPSSVSKLVRTLRLNNSVLTHMITIKKESTAHRQLANPQEVRPVKKPARGRTKP